jgi:hypothetical protein
MTGQDNSRRRAELELQAIRPRCSQLWLVLGLALTIALLGPRVSLSQGAIPRGLYLIEDRDTLVAANTSLNRIDSLRLIAKEKVEQQVVAEAVAVVITSDRLLAYSALGPGWSREWRRVKEDIERVEANDFGALVVTSDRLMTFNAGSGLWVQRRR